MAPMPDRAAALSTAVSCVAMGLPGCIAYKVPVDAADAGATSDTIYLAVSPYSGADHRDDLFEAAIVRADGLALAKPGQTHTVAAELQPETELRCFSEPYLTVFSLGIIPDVNCASYGFQFELDPGSAPTLVDTRGEVTAVFGWAALFMRLSKSWSGEATFSQYEARQLEAGVREALEQPE